MADHNYLQFSHHNSPSFLWGAVNRVRDAGGQFVESSVKIDRQAIYKLKIGCKVNGRLETTETVDSPEHVTAATQHVNLDAAAIALRSILLDPQFGLGNQYARITNLRVRDLKDLPQFPVSVDKSPLDDFCILPDILRIRREGRKLD